MCNIVFVYIKVEVDFDQRRYFGSEEDGVTQEICITVGPQADNSSEFAALEFDPINVTVNTYSLPRFTVPHGMSVIVHNRC